MVVIDKVQPIQCTAGHRRDCVNKGTCVFRHIGEVVGDPLVNVISIPNSILSGTSKVYTNNSVTNNPYTSRLRSKSSSCSNTCTKVPVPLGTPLKGGLLGLARYIRKTPEKVVLNDSNDLVSDPIEIKVLPGSPENNARGDSSLLPYEGEYKSEIKCLTCQTKSLP